MVLANTYGAGGLIALVVPFLLIFCFVKLIKIKENITLRRIGIGTLIVACVLLLVLIINVNLYLKTFVFMVGLFIAMWILYPLSLRLFTIKKLARLTKFSIGNHEFELEYNGKHYVSNTATLSNFPSDYMTRKIGEMYEIRFRPSKPEKCVLCARIKFLDIFLFAIGLTMMAIPFIVPELM